MANRRMFSNRIANSARFLQMPAESQLLYFHMVLRADDDGIVESYPLIRLLGVPSDNFKVLLAKGFIRQLNEDQVVLINDWKEHNTIRADRKIDSIYLPLLVAKVPDVEVLVPKPRSDVKDNSKRLAGQSTDSISYVRLGKVKLSKVNTEREITHSPTNKYVFIDSLKEEDLQDISSKYELPMSFIRSKYDDMILWAGERPNNSKLRGRNWKLTLMKWCKTDGLKIRKENNQNDKKRGIDANEILRQMGSDGRQQRI